MENQIELIELLYSENEAVYEYTSKKGKKHTLLVSFEKNCDIEREAISYDYPGSETVEIKSSIECVELAIDDFKKLKKIKVPKSMLIDFKQEIEADLMVNWYENLVEEY